MLAAALGAALLTLPVHCADRDALLKIEQRCAAHWQAQHDAAPCEEVGSDHVVLADRKGGAHFLLIATRPLAGIESPALLAPDAPNYFAAAWRARDRLDQVVGHHIERGAVGLAVNPLHHRTQDQLHIHIECLRPAVAEALNAAAGHLAPGRWEPLLIEGADYEALRVDGEELGEVNPFKLLSAHLALENPADRPTMDDHTLILAGRQFPTAPGFVLLAGRARAGELLLDSTCALAQPRAAPGGIAP